MANFMDLPPDHPAFGFILGVDPATGVAKATEVQRLAFIQLGQPPIAAILVFELANEPDNYIAERFALNLSHARDLHELLGDFLNDVPERRGEEL